jgi:glycosyltransferase involved in cell wall biosynthesis
MARVGVVSFRLGGSDGVSIEAAKWCGALANLGHEVRTIAGAGRADVIVDALAMDATAPPSRDELRDALDGIDLVVVENVASLPLNPVAREVLYDVLEGRRALFHHHDLAWQREHLAHLEGPRTAPTWRHVTINELSRRELAERGIDATLVRNSFDCDPPAGDRVATRRALGVGDERVALVASRAIARKNVPAALDLAGYLGATLWILGPSEDGYEGELQRLLERSRVAVRRGLPAGRSVHDAYAAADLVVMSSTWEGFGNPVLESVTHRRPLALHRYPVAREIESFGFTFFGLDDVARISSFLDEPDASVLERNLLVARRHFNLDDLPARLASVLNLEEAAR